MDLAIIGAAMIAVAVVSVCAVLGLVLIYSILSSSIQAYKEKDEKTLVCLGFVWWLIIGIFLLLIGSI